MRIALIGGGKMAEAIIAGVIRGNVARAQDITVSDILESRRSHLQQQYAVPTTTQNREAAARGDLVVLAVKPQNLPEVLEELRGQLRREQAALSIVAGARMATLTQGLGHGAVIRVMPNTPAQEGVGMSVWMASPQVPPQALEETQAILKTLGEEVQVHDEEYLDMATALSASGPAYVFTFAEALIDAGVYLGLPRDMARTLVLQTLLGSVVLMQRRHQHPAVLRDMVTSPGGTTTEALLELEEGAFRATIINAVAAAYEKSRALGEEQ